MTHDRPTFGSLFAGIGGIDLGLERAGWQGRWQVEYEPFCQRVLAKHWPDVTRYGDIHDVDWSGVEPVDLVAGGFPCQPVSYAGRGLAQDDVRWLWPQFARAVRALRPRYVLVENVPGLLRRGLGDVLGDLAALGYDAEWDCIPAAAVGAPHLRDRVWIVAYADGLGQGRSTALGPPGLTGLRPGEAGPEPDGAGHRSDAADADSNEHKGDPYAVWWATATELLADPSSIGGGALGADLDHAQWTDGPSRSREQPSLADTTGNGREPRRTGDAPQVTGGREPSRSGIESDPLADTDRARLEEPRGLHADLPLGPGRTAVALEEWWATEPDVGRVAHGVPARVDRLRALGNAVVPQVVEFIGRRILEAEGLR